jgi:hypothetical protein
VRPILAGFLSSLSFAYPCAFYRWSRKRTRNQALPNTTYVPKGSEKEVAHLLVKSGTDSVDVYLCSKSFFDVMGMSFGKGDEVTLTGSKVKHGEADLILARKVVRGNDTFVLRDEKGNPF